MTTGLACRVRLWSRRVVSVLGAAVKMVRRSSGAIFMSSIHNVSRGHADRESNEVNADVQTLDSQMSLFNRYRVALMLKDFKEGRVNLASSSASSLSSRGQMEREKECM